MTVAFFGIVIGAALQYVFTRHLDSQRHHRELRSTAYIDYFRRVLEHTNLGKNRKTDEGRSFYAKTADAKCRICLYGSRATIEAFAKFERLGATMNERLFFFGLFERFDQNDTEEQKHAVYNKILARAITPKTSPFCSYTGWR
ncbi:MAG: hypothetical protein HLX50_15340 [Alteromonadaceae bacterium]|nr:hypothetical protein [Alteromonadaceae bacterium]